MFRMSHDIIVRGVNNNKPFKCSSMKWKRSVDSYSDYCSIKVPAITRLRKEGDNYENVQTGLIFKEGMQVEVYAGYGGKNDLHFKGFISRVNFSIPLEIECEGYSYQLRKKNFNKAYKSGFKLKKLLEDLVDGTDIKLSKDIPDVPLEVNATFPNFRGVDVLEWLKDKALQTVYFNGEELYCGLQQTQSRGMAKVRLGWNSVKDSELKFSTDKEYAQVKFQLDQPKEKDGSRKRAIKDSKYSDTFVKRLKVRFDQGYLDQMADDQKKQLVNRGYEGSVMLFLKPFFAPAMTIDIEDTKYPERAGKYFVTAVEGEFSSRGGRQKVTIGNSL
jgi:hypothetical protein